MIEKNIDRRNFVKGAVATGAVAAAGSALASCSPSDSSEDTDSTTDDDVMTADKFAETKWSFEIPPDPIDDSEITETYTHDIVIVGSGMSGLCTAVSCQENGGDVIVFSASSKPISRGGSNHAVGSSKQKELGIEYDAEIARKIVKEEQTGGAYMMDKKKWAKWINNSGESMDWMIEKMASKGLNCCIEPAYNDPDDILTIPAASHSFWNEDTPMGMLYGAPLCAQAYADIFTDNGGEIHYNTIAQYLIRDDDNTGRVSAVIAQTSDGSYVKYEANKAIVLATGDFSRNADMMQRYSPWAWENYKDILETDTVDYDVELNYSGLMPGDGQKMGLWIGAAWQKTFPVAPMINCGVNGPLYGNSIDNFWGCCLDCNGERFMNETTNFSYSAHTILQLPKQMAFGVWDNDYYYRKDEWESFGCSINNENGIYPSTSDEMKQNYDDLVDNENYFKADTLQELFDQIDDIDTDNALATIERYNKYAEQGLDEEFHVNPDVLFPIQTAPFYASKNVKGSSSMTFLTVCGGLRTNEDMQVCDEDDNPIEGLYNTGIMTGDFYSNVYNFVMPGQNLGGVCCTLSYLLGQDLAEL